MSNAFLLEGEIVSARTYGLILTSPRLSRQLLPQGLQRSPYAVLVYDGHLALENAWGSVATFARRQKVRFQQHGVEALLDHFWGSGITLAGYWTNAGRTGDLILDNGRQHLVIELPRPMDQGETLDFATERTIRESFGRRFDHFDLVIDHPVMQLRQAITFPCSRPCQAATLTDGDHETPLPVRRHADGSTSIRVNVPDPHAHRIYRLAWTW
jgi:hypothetical protein